MKPRDLYGMMGNRASGLNLENLVLSMSIRDQKLMEMIEKLNGTLDSTWELSEVLDVSSVDSFS